jgi:nanoRNase/pAp phosphatase (c-di-AMP/oligoRNAs hydrolase)
MPTPEQLDRTRRFTDDLLTWVRGRGKIVIVVHENPDPDCLASAIALRHLFIMKLGKEAVITFSGMIGRSENIAMAKELEIPLTPFDLVSLDDFPVVCMLDTQPGTGNNALPANARVDLVIDHHPLREATKQCRWVDVRDDYGVTATILYEYLLAQEVTIGTKLATALFYAIKSDTQDLGRESARPDREAYQKLFPLTSKRLLYEITHPRLPPEYFLTLSKAFKGTRIYGPLLVVNLRTVIFPEIVAEIADLLLRLEGIETVLSMGQYTQELVLSLRTVRHDLNAGEIIRQVVAGHGLAGGHGMMAGGKVSGLGTEPRQVRSLERLFTRRLLALLGIDATVPRKLVS